MRARRARKRLPVARLSNNRTADSIAADSGGVTFFE